MCESLRKTQIQTNAQGWQIKAESERPRFSLAKCPTNVEVHSEKGVLLIGLTRTYQNGDSSNLPLSEVYSTGYS